MNATTPSSPSLAQLHVAVIGAGMAGVVAARTLLQAGHRVTLFEKSRGVGGRMATRRTEFGGFDHGAQYFTVRDPRFELVLRQTASALVRPWSASTVRVLDAFGHLVASAPPALSRPLAQPELHGHPPAGCELNTRVTRIERDALNAKRWQLRTEDADGGRHVHSGFDRVVLAIPHVQADDLLKASALAPALREPLADVSVAPCWTLMVAFPQAMQPGLGLLGPQWNAARSTHHRIAWLTRESSKPARDPIERWTVQANPTWSAEHLEDDPERVKAKLLKAFSEVTGIRATPPHAVVHRWLYAQTQQALGQPYLLDKELGIGLCGDWCLGHRVENAFVSGLELALAMA